MQLLKNYSFNTSLINVILEVSIFPLDIFKHVIAKSITDFT